MDKQAKHLGKMLKSEDPRTRYEAIVALGDLREEEISVKITTLEYLVLQASEKFPESVDSWDDPSFHLIHFISAFQVDEVVEPIVNHFKDFSPFAQNRSLDYLCEIGSEKSMRGILTLLQLHMPKKEINLNAYTLGQQTEWLPEVLDKTLKNYLQEDKYRKELFYLLLKALESNVILLKEKELVLSEMKKEQKSLWEKLKQYEEAYQTKFVYNAWKDSYFDLRAQYNVIFKLCEYYFDSDIQANLEENMKLKDPILCSTSVSVALQKGIKVGDEAIQYCSEHVESAEYFYYELLRRNKEHLFYAKDKKQPVFAKSHLFEYIVHLEEKEVYPEVLSLVDSVEIENRYNQPIRYYLFSFGEESEQYAGWVGAYSLEQGDDEIYMWDGTFTDWVPFEKYSVEEHLQQFEEKRKEERSKFDENVRFESKPRWNHWYWLLVAFFSLRVYQFPAEDHISQLITVIFGLWVMPLVVKRFLHVRKGEVHIQGLDLMVNSRKESFSVGLHEIKEIKLERSRFYFDDEMIVVEKKDGTIHKFPEFYVNKEEFAEVILANTSHLKEQPFIEI